MKDRDTTFEDVRPAAGLPDTPLRTYLFAVLHCDAPSLGGGRWALDRTDTVAFTRASEPTSERASTDDGELLTIAIPGKFVSRAHARLVRARDAWVVVDDGSRNGTYVNGERITRATLSDGDVIEVGHTLFVYRAAAATPAGSGDDLRLSAAPVNGAPLATLVPAIEGQNRALERVAKATVPILLVGESGSGKEVAARSVHALSGRPGEIVAVNCGAIPQGLVESALFGHARGAFSGATRDEPGFLRTADRGTVFLDEVGDLPPSAQTTLLRVLEDSAVVPVGSTRGVTVDVRFVAATHQPIRDLVARGAFRHDLFARLLGFEHQVAPLRERLVDLGILVGALLSPATAVTVAAGLALLQHAWPLNVRELRQCLAAGQALAAGEPIDVAHLPRDIREPPGQTEAADDGVHARLLALLAEHKGNVSAVARAFGKAPVQIHRWMRRWNVDLESFRAPRSQG